MNKLVLIFIFSLSACASSKVNLHQESVRDKLFPPGVYHHNVTLQIHPTEKTYQFEGVVKLTSKEITIVVLSFFGTTEFKIHEDLESHDVQTEIYRDEFKKFEPKLKEYYSTLRYVLLAKSDVPRNKIEKVINGEPVTFLLEDYDKNQIPGKVQIQGSHFNVMVKVTQYEI